MARGKRILWATKVSAEYDIVAVIFFKDFILLLTSPSHRIKTF
jgi:hypothetical protein